MRGWSGRTEGWTEWEDGGVGRRGGWRGRTEG